MIFLYKAGSFIFATSVKSESLKFSFLQFESSFYCGLGQAFRYRLGTPQTFKL